MRRFMIYLLMMLFLFIRNLLIPKNMANMAWITSFILFIFGIYCATITENWDNFSRFGSLIVIVALGTYYAHFESHAESMKKLAADFHKNTSRRLVEASVTGQLDPRERAEFEKIGAAITEIGTHADNFNPTEAGELLSRHSFRIAIIGTFVWGFGDLVGYLI